MENPLVISNILVKIIVVASSLVGKWIRDQQCKLMMAGENSELTDGDDDDDDDGELSGEAEVI